MHIYRGFFSYAHSDAAADPDLVEAFTKLLELRVSNKLTNASFVIWRDTEGIRIGEKWDATIENAVKESDIFIVLLSPKWVESDYCRKEYLAFTAVEDKRSVGEYVAPLLVREFSGQKRHFTEQQARVVGALEQRQYVRTLASSFVELTKDQRVSLIERVADDVSGMVERLRDLPADARGGEGRPKRLATQQKEFSIKARNFEEVDFVDRPEIELHDLNNGTTALVGQFDFVDRLYIQSEKARVEFGIRRAHLIVRDREGGEIERSEHLRNRAPNICYVTLQGDPDALVVSIDPPSGYRVLGELALPPGPKAGENRLSEIGLVSSSQVEGLHAELSVSLCAEGLGLTEPANAVRSNAMKAAIQAIVAIAVAKNKGARNGHMVRDVRIRKPRK